MQRKGKLPIVTIGEKIRGMQCGLCDRKSARIVKRSDGVFSIRLCDVCLNLISQPRVNKIIEIQQNNEKRLLRALKEQGFITDPTYGGPDIRD